LVVEVEISFGVPEEIVSVVKEKFKNEKENNLRVTLPNPRHPPYYAAGDPRATPQKITFEGKEYWVWRVTPGKK
jgi:hypothetical protein